MGQGYIGHKYKRTQTPSQRSCCACPCMPSQPAQTSATIHCRFRQAAPFYPWAPTARWSTCIVMANIVMARILVAESSADPAKIVMAPQPR